MSEIVDGLRIMVLAFRMDPRSADAINKAADRIERLEAALEFYADPSGDVPDSYDELDFGARAKAALEGKDIGNF